MLASFLILSILFTITKQAHIPNIPPGNLQNYQIPKERTSQPTDTLDYTITDVNKVLGIKLLLQCENIPEEGITEDALKVPPPFQVSFVDLDDLPDFFIRPEPISGICPLGDLYYIESQVYNNLKFMCDFYEKCTIRFTFTRQSVSFNYRLIVLEEFALHALTPINLKDFVQTNLRVPIPLTPPVQNEKLYGKITPIIELRFYYQMEGQNVQEIAQHIGDEYVAYDKVTVTEDYQTGDSIEFENLTYDDRQYITSVFPKPTKKSGVRVFKCQNCLLKIQICFNKNAIEANNFNGQEEKQFIQYHHIEQQTMQGTLNFKPEDSGIKTIKLVSNTNEQFLQIEKQIIENEVKTFKYFKYRIEIPVPNLSRPYEYDFRQDNMEYRYVYSNPEFNSKECFIHIYSDLNKISVYQEANLIIRKSSTLATSIMQYSDVKEDDPNADFEFYYWYIETNIGFIYKGAKDSNYLNFQYLNKTDRVFVNRCKDQNDLNKCEIPSKNKHQYEAKLNSKNLNKFVLLDDTLNQDTYFSGLIECDKNWNFRGEKIEGSKGPLYYKRHPINEDDFADNPYSDGGKQKYYEIDVYMSDRFLFQSDISTWTYIIIIETIVFFSLFGLCVLQYYIDFPKYWRMFLSVYEKYYKKYISDPKDRKKQIERQLKKQNSKINNIATL